MTRRKFVLLCTTAAAFVSSKLAQAAFAIFQTSSVPPIIPANRLAPWQPGVTYNGGISNRTTIHSTLSPIGQVAQITATVTGSSSPYTLSVSAVVSGTLTTAANQAVYTGGGPTTGGTLIGVISAGSGSSYSLIGASGALSSRTFYVYGDDTSAINSALSSAGAAASSGNPQVVLLNSGVFGITGNGVSVNASYVTLRGSGLPAAMATGGNLSNDNLSQLNYVSGTWLVKTDRIGNPSGNIIQCGRIPDWTAILNGSSTNLTANTVQGQSTCTVASTSGLSVGMMVVIDHITDTDPNVAWNNVNDLSGSFVGTLSGTSLTVTNPTFMNNGVVQGFTATISGTSLTVTAIPNSLAYITQVGSSQVHFTAGTTIWDATGTVYYGYIASGTYPNFTMSQSNTSGTGVSLQIGGVVPTDGTSVFWQYPIFDSVFSTNYGFINGGSFPNFTMNQSNTTQTNVNLTFGGGSRRHWSRQDRSIAQLMKITNISGNTITFETPFYYSFLTAYTAQLSRFDPSFHSFMTGISVESLGMFGGPGGNGNLNFGMCTLSWAKNVESYWANGTGIGMFGCYRCEVRDSLMHESPSPTPGGAGYVCGMGTFCSDCLFENCIMWNGDKQDVIRGGCSGCVIGYCYMDDAWGETFPQSPEAGVNAGHACTPAYCLLEGNYSHNFEADAYWGASFCITIHRNWLSGIRGCSPTGTTVSNSSTSALKAFTYFNGSQTLPYGDYNGRRMADVQSGSFNHNFTGNILGFSSQSLLSYNAGGYTTAQTTWVYEELDSFIDTQLNVIMWNIGALQLASGFVWNPNVYQTVLRSGNWTWNSPAGGGQQDWHGIGGSRTYGGNLSPPYPSIPNTYYTGGSAPAFFATASGGPYTWPWVDPTTGSTNQGLPARVRWLNNTPNTL